MTNLRPHITDTTVRLSNGNILAWSECISGISFQVNLLSLLVLTSISVGWLTGLFAVEDRLDKALLLSAVISLSAVWFLNRIKMNELGSIICYVALNVLSLVTYQLFDARPLETVLTYVFLMSLIIFLFEARLTRFVCMLIVLLRITLYTLKVHSIDVPADMPIHTDNPTAYLAYDILMLFLLALVFVLYGWKLFYAENAKRQKTLFSQHMSHDLKGALKSLTSTIGVLKYNKDKKGKVDLTLIDEVVDAANFCDFISGNFLDYLRQERSVATVFLERFDLSAALETIAELYKYEGKGKNVQIDLQVDDRIPTLVYSDKVKVIRIALNLLTNAIDHSEPGKSITMAVSWNDGAWELTVANEGPYIPPEDIPKLFAPFDSGKSHDRNKRLGLGLPIAKQLTEVLGGRISATSREGGRTIFTVAFPKFSKSFKG